MVSFLEKAGLVPKIVHETVTRGGKTFTRNRTIMIKPKAPVLPGKKIAHYSIQDLFDYRNRLTGRLRDKNLSERGRKILRSKIKTIGDTVVKRTGEERKLDEKFTQEYREQMKPFGENPPKAESKRAFRNLMERYFPNKKEKKK